MIIFAMRELSKLAALGCAFLAAWSLTPSEHPATQQAVNSALTASAVCGVAACVLFAAAGVAAVVLNGKN